MRRAIIAAALLLSLASQALGAPARLALYTPRRLHPTTENNAMKFVAAKSAAQWAAMCDELGIYYDVVDPEQIPTKQALEGLWYYGPGGLTRAYEVNLHTFFYVNVDNTYNRCNRDSLTRYGVWTSQGDRKTINIFSGPPGINIGNPPSSQPWAQNATCSTGVASFTLAFKSAPFYGFGLTSYAPGSRFSWMTTMQSTDYPQAVALASNNPGITRTLIGMRRNVALYDGAAGYRSSLCNDCDSLAAGPGAPHDSATAWVRYRSADDKYPNIYLNAMSGEAQGIGAVGVAEMLAVLAHADSLLGGRLIGQKPGWAPTKLSLTLVGAFKRSTPPTYAATDIRGRAVNPADSVRYRSVVADSVRKLGIPLTIFVDPDSAAVYGSEIRWYKDLGFVRFAPVKYGSSVSAADFASLSAMFPGKVARATHAIDYIGGSYGKSLTGWGSVDAWNRALFNAGVRVAVIEPDDVNMSPNTSWSTQGTASWATATDAYLFSNSPRLFPVYANDERTGSRLGTIRYVSSQLGPSETADGLGIVHCYGTDFLNGVFFKLRLNTDQRFYYHTYRHQNTVYRADASSLAGNGPASTETWPKRWGWFAMKQAVMPTLVANMYAGRQIVRWVFVDEQ